MIFSSDAGSFNYLVALKLHAFQVNEFQRGPWSYGFVDFGFRGPGKNEEIDF